MISQALSSIRPDTPLRRALTKCIREVEISLLHFVGTRSSRRFKKAANLKLNVGCGRKLKQGWINIDFDRVADLTLDIRRSLPFSDKSCLIIYSEHFLEHLEYPNQVNFFLEEALRVLCQGGIFSVGVPDTEWPLRAYSEKEACYFEYAKQLWHPKWCVTRIEHINYHFRQVDEHKFAYDFETLKNVLEKAGFVQVRRRDFNPYLDSEDRELGTLYVEAIKRE